MWFSLFKLASTTLCLVSVVDALPSATIPVVLPRAVNRTTPPSGCLSVGNGGQYGTITEAITALGSGTLEACIFIYPGTYTEDDGVSVKYKGPLTLYGSTPE